LALLFLSFRALMARLFSCYTLQPLPALLLVAVLWSCSSVLFAQSPKAGASAPMALRTVPNDAFGFGEELYYRVGYRFITAGSGMFKIEPKPTDRNGRPCYDIRFEVASLKSLEFLYRVRNMYRSLIDVDGVFSWYFEQKNREGNYRKDYSADMNHRTGIAKTTEGEFPLEPFTHDIVSAFFYIRTLNLKAMKRGDIVPLKNFYEKETYPLAVKILGRETIEVSAGKFNCVVIEPLVQEGGLFQHKGRLLIWLSDDDRKIPVKVATGILIGTVDVELTGFKGLRGPLAAKIEAN
jgi:hypothetical protein